MLFVLRWDSYRRPVHGRSQSCQDLNVTTSRSDQTGSTSARNRIILASLLILSRQVLGHIFCRLDTPTCLPVRHKRPEPMAQGKKKKKVAANPQRGFATTSIPSKKAEPTPADDSAEPEADERPVSVPNGSGNHEENAAGNNHEFSGPGVDSDPTEARLQSLVSIHGSRISKDARNQAEMRQREKRLLRLQGFPIDHRQWFSDRVISSILSEAFPAYPSPLLFPDYQKVLDSDEALLKIWSLRQFLVRLHLPGADAALTHAVKASADTLTKDQRDEAWGATAAFEWLAANGHLEEEPMVETRKDIDTSDIQMESTIRGMYAQFYFHNADGIILR